MHTPPPVPLSPRIVLGVAAHPDDLDFAAGGTMATFAKQGAHVYYLILTDGGKGSQDRTMSPERLRDIRRDEQRQAGRILGLKDVFFCDFPDGTLESTLDVKQQVVQYIRKLTPDVLVVIDPSILFNAHYGFINHPDHRAAGQAALDAVYPLARDHMAFPELLDKGLEPHNTSTVLLFDFAPEVKPFAVDVTDTLDQKLQAIAAHASQFSDLEKLQAELRQRAEATGRQNGYQYAESFVRIDIA